jgi:putative transcriptional regulator
MPIVVTLDVMLSKRKMKSKDLAAIVGITEQNLSLLKSGKVRGVRFDTLPAGRFAGIPRSARGLIDAGPAGPVSLRRDQPSQSAQQLGVSYSRTRARRSSPPNWR